MRVAALYDIHGNLPALEAVLEEIQADGVDQVVVGGDVMPGPMPGRCLEALAALSVPVRFLYGNGERDVVAMHDGAVPTRVPPQFHEVLLWVVKQLEPAQLEAVAAWPASVVLNIPSLGSVGFWHATPRDENEIFTRVTPEDRVRPILEGTGVAVMVCGHTHMQFDRKIGAVRVINAGSVGMPFGVPGAYWALVSPEGVDLRRTSYDLEGASARIEAAHYPSEFDVVEPPRASEMLEVLEAAALGGSLP